jgi:hypothetical protein
MVRAALYRFLALAVPFVVVSAEVVEEDAGGDESDGAEAAREEPKAARGATGDADGVDARGRAQREHVRPAGSDASSAGYAVDAHVAPRAAASQRAGVAPRALRRAVTADGASWLARRSARSSDDSEADSRDAFVPAASPRAPRSPRSKLAPRMRAAAAARRGGGGAEDVAAARRLTAANAAVAAALVAAGMDPAE